LICFSLMMILILKAEETSECILGLSHKVLYRTVVNIFIY
jgi:hypothetical protein